MAFGASSSSSNQEYVLCDTDYLKVYKTTTADNKPEVSAAGLQSEEQKDTSASIDFRVEEEEERPPYVIVVQGPRKVGKSTLIRSLADHYADGNPKLDLVCGRDSVTIITGKRRRIQFLECPNNVNGMRNAAKYADAVILLMNAHVGFEMETFEFVNVLRLQGMPKVMGVLTFLDMFDNYLTRKIRIRKRLFKQFSIEICKEARLFCLSGLDHGVYKKGEVLDLASFISATDFHPLSWQAAQPYLLSEHFEDVTRPETAHMDIRCNRDIVLHGYLRGSDIKKGGAKVHIVGVGDFPLFSVTSLADPCPLLAGPKKKRSRKGKELDESEGFRSGTYLRLEVRDVPFEIVENYDPYHPILVGGISPGEENVEYMQAKDTAVIDLTVKEEEPPYVIVVHGPPKVGKSLLIRSLVEHYTKENLNNVQGPVTIISGEQRRIQFVECPNSVSGMLDAAKYADAVILLIDTSIGFEMETFEFVNILRVHGMPKVMGVLISRDSRTHPGILLSTKKYIINRFCTEIYEGATLFSLSGLEHGKYQKHEFLDLASFISVMEFHPLSWRAAQPYVLVDRYEDVTLPERVVMDNRCSRDIVLYGYLRGCDIKKGTKVHIAGMGDFPLFGVTSYFDPCLTLKMRRSQKGKEEEEYLGFRPGSYLRLEVQDVPFEMVENIDLYHPILVGGISPGEENVGYMQATLERHTWHRKLLKTGDPIIVSIGWRRYQTIPVYAKEDHSEQLQMLNYTPVDTQCLAMFWGPLASPNTGVVAVQYLPDDKAAFRILAIGVIVDFNAAKILKKCKRSGTSWKISGKTALIKDLFRSDHEIERFKDAKVWTESGIQGKVKKATEKLFVDRSERNVSLLTERIVECKFKRRICMGDTVFMRVQKEVEVPRFFNPVVPMPLSDGPKEFPKGRRTVAFVEGKPSFQDRTIAKKFELDHCNEVEQREFKKHPMLVISKEEEMLNERREITKKHQPKPSVQWSPEGRGWQGAIDLYGEKIPSFYSFVRPPHHVKYLTNLKLTS
ncbi:hypothetical protein MKW92_043116 [Papaver armeniacum]|nr:hypothetical protein MKW92_043116 [Papaver armeniacum]